MIVQGLTLSLPSVSRTHKLYSWRPNVGVCMCVCVWVSVLLSVSLSVYVFVFCGSVSVCACVCEREFEAQVLSAMHCARGVVHASTVNKRDMQYYTCTSLSTPPWSSVLWLLLNLCYCPWFLHLCIFAFFHSIHSCVVGTCVCSWICV